MTGRALTWILTGVIGVAICVIGALIGLTGAAMACTPMTEPSGVAVTGAPGQLASTYDSEQLANADIIVTVGVGRGVPTRGLIIAVATAIQESSLHNYGDLGDRNDHDSLGLFQQRPSQGWGAPQQIMDPIYASNKFYDKLLTVDGWETMPLTAAAQAVQISAYPNAYAKWEPDATAIVAMSNGISGGCTGGDGQAGGPGEQLPADFSIPADTPLPVAIAIWWALSQLGTPYHFAGSCTDPHGSDPTKQCDCSSLVQQAYKNGGISLPRVTYDQQHAGTPVAGITDLTPGDLIFIPGSDGSPDQPGHVGMYIGHGLLIQAPHTGDYVKLTKVSAWANEIAKIRRIVAS
jgi:cell wall-associated NlpC family hydrolase